MISNNRIETKIGKIEKSLELIRDELKLCAKKEDLKQYPTREEVKGIVQSELKPYPTREEVKSIVQSELKPYPTREEVRQMIHDGVDIIRVLIEGYRSDFRISIDGYKGLDGRVSSLEHRVDMLEK